MAASKVQTVDAMPATLGRGRKRNFLPQSNEAAAVVLDGKIASVNGDDALKISSQVRTLILEKGFKLITKTDQGTGTIYMQRGKSLTEG